MGVEGEDGQTAQGLLAGGLKKRTSLACTTSPIDAELSDPTQCADGFDRPDARG